MTYFRSAACVCFTILFLTRIASADDARYYPSVSGRPAGVVAGQLLDFGFGNASGGFTVRTTSGKIIDFYTGRPPFRINGEVIDCPQPPKRNFTPARVDCPHWPSQVVVGRTAIRVPYWRGRRYNKPTLIATGFETIRR